VVELPFFYATLFAKGVSGRAPACASGDKLCGKMREKDPGSKKTAVTTAIQQEVSMRIHDEKKEGEGKRGRDRDRDSFNEFRADREARSKCNLRGSCHFTSR